MRMGYASFIASLDHASFHVLMQLENLRSNYDLVFTPVVTASCCYLKPFVL